MESIGSLQFTNKKKSKSVYAVLVCGFASSFECIGIGTSNKDISKYFDFLIPNTISNDIEFAVE